MLNLVTFICVGLALVVSAVLGFFKLKLVDIVLWLIGINLPVFVTMAAMYYRVLYVRNELGADATDMWPGFGAFLQTFFVALIIFGFCLEVSGYIQGTVRRLHRKLRKRSHG